MENNPKVSIIIPTYNEEKDIEKTLLACVNLTYPNKEIIVVDDSTDNTPEIVRKFENQGVRLIKRKENKGGRCGARNEGILKSSGEILIILNADVILPKDFIEKILPHYQKGAGMVLVNSEAINKEKIIPRFIDANEKFNHQGSWDWVYWTEGFSCLKQAAFDAGLFPTPKIVLTAGEDGYFGKKIIEKGYKRVIDKSVKVFHFAPDSFSEFFKLRKERVSVASYFLEKKSLWSIFIRQVLKTLLFLFKTITVVFYFIRGYQLSKFDQKNDILAFAGLYFVQDLAFVLGGWSSFFKIVKFKIF